MTGRVEVTSADIARLAGVKPTAVSNWRRRHADFPAPIGGTDRGPRFDLNEIETWMARQGRGRQISADQRLWQAFESVRGSVSPEDALAAVGMRLVSRMPGAAVPQDHDGLLGNPRLGVLLAAAEQGDFESLCTRYLEAPGRNGFAATAPRLADLMIRIAGTGRRPGSLLDPACGSGTILLAAAMHGHRPLTGYELNPSITRIAGLRLALRNVDDVHIQVEDALRRPPAVFRTVVTTPPFAERDWGHDELAKNQRWEYGVPPRQEPELAWAQQALTQVEPGGMVVLLMPPAAAARPAGRRIRRELLVRGALQAVLSLPAGLATHYALALQIWVLRRPDDTPTPARLLLVDTGSDKPVAGETWDRVDDIVSDCWAEYSGGPTEFQERPGVARSVPVEELLDDDVDVTPRRSLPLPVPTVITSHQLKVTRDRFADLLATVDIELPELPQASYGRVVALQDLTAAGAVFIRRPGPVDRTRPSIHGRILTGADLSAGCPPSQEGEVDADEIRHPPIRAGDVLAPVVARRLTARVATADDIGAYPAATVYVVKTDPAVLDPWFLAGYLSSGDGGRQAERLGSSLGESTRIDLRRVRIPLVPIATQQEYGQQYRRLAEFAYALRTVHDLGLDLARDATDAITVGLTGRTH